MEYAPPTPCSCRDSGKSCVGLAAHTHPYHAPRQGKQAETHAQGAPSFLLFCSFLVPQDREQFYGHSPISSCPQQRWNEGALPLHQSPLGSPVQVCLRGRTCG